MATRKEKGRVVKDVYFIEVYDSYTESELCDPASSKTYYNLKDTINAAKKLAKEYSYMRQLVEITVFGGEYEDANKNVFGDSFDIFTASNKDKETTSKWRKKVGYVREEVDYYATSKR